jgi:hypothetical protein
MTKCLKQLRLFETRQLDCKFIVPLVGHSAKKEKNCCQHDRPTLRSIWRPMQQIRRSMVQGVVVKIEEEDDESYWQSSML